MENSEVNEIFYYECNCCSKKFSSLQSLTNHINLGYEGCRNTIQECPFKCALCGGQFTEGHPLRKHVIEVHEGHKDLRCDKCHTTFATKTSFKYHNKRKVITRVHLIFLRSKTSKTHRHLLAGIFYSQDSVRYRF